MATVRRPYVPGSYAGETLESLQDYVLGELDNIRDVFILSMLNPMEELHAEPGKLRTGLTVLADGTDWNPGAGQGVYTYYAAAWHKLG